MDKHPPKDYAPLEESEFYPPPPTPFFKFIGMAMIVCFAFWAAFFVIWLFTAEAHESPTGWKYGFECCSSFDCSQASSADIKETQMGYVIVKTGEVIKYGDKRIKQSKDEFFHRCAPQGNMSNPKSLCLYTPDRGY